MEALIIEGEFKFPSINFNPNSGLLEIVGRSIPENPVKLYQPLEDWIVEFIKTNPGNIILSVHLDYLNTHSTECVLILMKRLQAYYKESKNNVKVLWKFDEDDEDMEVLGEDLESIADLPFEFQEVVD
jgi:hypothetical protein